MREFDVLVVGGSAGGFTAAITARRHYPNATVGLVRKEKQVLIRVLEERCTGCGTCVSACPAGAISVREGKAHLHVEVCTSCEACVAACPQQALVVPVTPDRVTPVPMTPRPMTRGPVPPRQPAPGQLAPRELRPRAVGQKAVSRRESTGEAPAVRPGVVPTLGALLGLAVRELVPRLGPYLLDVIDRSASPRGCGPRGGRGRRGRCRRGYGGGGAKGMMGRGKPRG